MTLPENGRRQWNKTVTTLFNKTLGKNIFYFYLKSKEISGQPNVNKEQTLEKFERINYISMCDLL